MKCLNISNFFSVILSRIMSNDLVADLFIKSSDSVKEALNTLLEGKSIHRK